MKRLRIQSATGFLQRTRFFLPAVFFIGVVPGFFSGAVLAQSVVWPDVQLNALLGKKMAIITVDGQRHQLRLGEESPEGLTLTAIESGEATLQWQGETRSLTPSSRISTRYTENRSEVITVRRDISHHYIVRGQINGRSVDMVVDTGATIVALSSAQADALKLPWRESRNVGVVATAGGDTTAHVLILDKISIDGVDTYQIEAVVIPDQATPILLGMSYLRHFEMNESDNVLTLKKKF